MLSEIIKNLLVAETYSFIVVKLLTVSAGRRICVEVANKITCRIRFHFSFLLFTNNCKTIIKKNNSIKIPCAEKAQTHSKIGCHFKGYLLLFFFS